MLRANPSYVFFRRVEGLTLDQGPIGAMGVPLTPQRSVAVDRAFIPLGAPMWVMVKDPLARRDTLPVGRLVVAQDTGGAFSLVEHPVPPRTLAVGVPATVKEREVPPVPRPNVANYLDLAEAYRDAHPVTPGEDPL